MGRIKYKIPISLKRIYQIAEAANKKMNETKMKFDQLQKLTFEVELATSGKLERTKTEKDLAEV